MTSDPQQPGIREALVTARLILILEAADPSLIPEITALGEGEASDRISRHVARLLARAIEGSPDGERVRVGIQLARAMLDQLSDVAQQPEIREDTPTEPGEVLAALLRRLPDGRAGAIERPLTPLLDTTVFTNAPGEPSVGHELRAEVNSAEAIDVVMAFIRWSGVQPLIPALKRHCQEGKPLHVLTTTYTNSTEQRALDELASLGADVRVSYDTTMTRLHAKAWIFHRAEDYSTAYVGSSNLTHWAQVTGLEWNVRLSGVRNPDALAKVAAVFASYWASSDFQIYNAEEFQRRTEIAMPDAQIHLSPFELEPRPFQERLLELLAVARRHGHHKNLLVAATGTGKTVMAAIDYARLRETLPRDRLLFVAHRSEILQQSCAVFRHAMRDLSFGEMWVGGRRPSQFDHVFASIQSLSASGVARIDADHFDVVIIDEFHHAAAATYEALLRRLSPVELLGLTATPERADGLDVLGHFGGRIAAELRVWDAIDQQYLAPFAYFGVHDGMDLRDVPWRRGTGYDVGELTNLLTADHVWSNRVLEQVRDKIGDPGSMRALGFCVSVRHASFMAERFTAAGVPSLALSGASSEAEREQGLRDLASGQIKVLFSVDLFNEGLDIPTVDTLLLLRPTDSPTLFLQQLGRGLRKSRGKTVCTVLDFVGTHRKEFRFDRRFRALLGGSRNDLRRQIEEGFPFLPAGCHLELDAVAQEVVLRSIREALPTRWPDRCEELRILGDVNLATYLEETELELADVYAGGHSWSEIRRTAGLPTEPEGPREVPLLRAVGRLLHVDDDERIDAYRAFLASTEAPDPGAFTEMDRRRLRMLIASLAPPRSRATVPEFIHALWSHPQVRVELLELLDLLSGHGDHLDAPLGLPDVPLRIHARYTRDEILAAFGTGHAAKPPTWQAGVWPDAPSRSDLFAFTLDKSIGSFSPTTRYRDYAISPELIHWESQSATAEASEIGQRYINHRASGSNIVLFARLRTDDRAFWCLGRGSYVSHEGERPIAFVWKLEHRLPADLYSQFAAAVA
jgi:DNA or RNA helicases of superfamily II